MRAAEAFISMPLVEGSIRLPGPTASSEASGSVSSAHPHANPGVRVGPEPTSQSRWPRPQRRGWWCGSLTSQQGWGEEGLPALAEAMVHPPHLPSPMLTASRVCRALCRASVWHAPGWLSVQRTQASRCFLVRTAQAMLTPPGPLPGEVEVRRSLAS